MKTEVAKGIEELKRQFNPSPLIVREDDQGGAYIIIESLPLGSKYQPSSTWFGFQMTAQYPYADIYPIFIGEEVTRVDGVAFAAPISRGNKFEGRPAIQVSRKNAAAQNGLQKATFKILKVLDFLEKLP